VPHDNDNGRTHEPSLRELTAELDGLRDVIFEKIGAARVVMDERDKRYEERFTAMNEKTQSAIAASEKAVTKAEVSTEKRFDSVNEFRKTLADQATEFLTRREYSSTHQALVDKIGDLRESRSEGIGRGATWGTVLVIAGIAAGVLVTYLTMAHH
jgi:hypothetical protein